VEAVVSRGRCEYVKEVAGGFPTRVFLELVDLPWADAGRFTTWADTIFVGFFTTPAALTAFTEVREYFTEWVTQRRRHPLDPTEDFTSHLLASKVDGRLLPDDDVLTILNQLMLAGLDTVKSALSYSVWHLVTHDADRRAVAADPATIPFAIEELLRAYPLVMEGRKLSRDVDFHGATMRTDEMVMLALPAVMHDPAWWDRPDEVLLDRSGNTHLSFGGGPHRCLGSHLARIELRVAPEEWHRLVPEYGLGCRPDEVIERGGQLSLRALPLVWAVA